MLRGIFYQWDKDQITLGNASIWDEVTAYVEVPSLIAAANLLLDSCDFRLQGKASVSLQMIAGLIRRIHQHKDFKP